ncbi:unnamed protein product [Auanema sp. JU1783]|nr:unnamed protein product [Auanema sp. JU1783]
MRECEKEFDSLFNSDHHNADRIFYQAEHGDSAYDDLFSLDTQMLLPVSDHIDLIGEGLSSLTNATISAYNSGSDTDKDNYKASSNPMDLFNLEFNDCSSSNSCDSGKDSPSGSESLYDQSPWTFSNEPVNEIIVEQQDIESSSFDGFAVDYPTSTIQSNTLNHRDVQPNASLNARTKYVYYVPEPGAEKEPFKFRTRAPMKVAPAPPKPKVFVSSNNGLQIRNYQSLRTHPLPSSVATSSPNPSAVATTAPVRATTAVGTSVSVPNIQIAPALVKFTQYDEVDDWQKRQEDRRIKNRAAAQASRQRKRTEIDEMKAKVAQLEAENETLKSENLELKSRLSSFTETQGSRSWKIPQNRKRAAFAGVCMMALFMMVSVSPIDLQKSSRPSFTNAESTVSHHISHGKVLKYDDPIVDSKSQNETISCGFKKPWLNKTETIRLNTDLYNWVDRHEQMDLNLKKGKRVLLRNGPKSWPASLVVERVNVTEINQPTRTVSEKKEQARQTAIRDRAWKHLDMISQSSYTLRDKRDKAKKLIKMEKQQLQEHSPSREQYEKLAASIQHRPDTLYVVTMKDYFLLPAITRNETSRPRIALILPALSLNGTISSQVSMMRIDLDVVGTGLFHLSREFVPLFFT